MPPHVDSRGERRASAYSPAQRRPARDAPSRRLSAGAHKLLFTKPLRLREKGIAASVVDGHKRAIMILHSIHHDFGSAD